MSGLAQLDAGFTVGGDFRVIEPLKHGGMGSVYVVEQLQTGARRALKLMHPQLVQDPKFRKRFEQEARIGAQIPSEHVVQVIAAGVDSTSGTAWLVMELLEGEDLDSHLRRRGHLPQAEATEVLGQLCHALAAAHSVGIVHRDLKPANIFLAVARRRGVPFTVKVLDFGIAKIVAEANTQATEAVGSPMWMAPEQTTQDHEILPATDVWALGLLTFRLLTGRYYWKAPNKPGATTAMLFREILIEPLPSAAQRAAEHGVVGLPKGFDAWFGKCVAREPEARFKNAGEAFASLEKILIAPKPGAAPAPMDVLVWKDGKDSSKQKRRDSEEVAQKSGQRASDPVPKRTSTSANVLAPVVDVPPPRDTKPTSSSAKSDADRKSGTDRKSDADRKSDVERKSEATSQVPFEALDESIQRASRAASGSVDEVDARASTPPDLEAVVSVAPDTMPARPAFALDRAAASGKKEPVKPNSPDDVVEVKGRRSDPGPAPKAKPAETKDAGAVAKPAEAPQKPFVVKGPEPKPAPSKEPAKAKSDLTPAKPAATPELKETPRAKTSEPPPKPLPAKPAETKPVEAKEPAKAKPVEPPPKAKPAEPPPKPAVAKEPEPSPTPPAPEPVAVKYVDGKDAGPESASGPASSPIAFNIFGGPLEPLPTSPGDASDLGPRSVPKVAANDRPATQAEKPAAKPAEKPAASAVETPVDKPTAKPIELPVEKPAQKPVEMPVAKPVDIDLTVGAASVVADARTDSLEYPGRPARKFGRLGAIGAIVVAGALALFGVRSYQNGQSEHVCETESAGGDVAGRLEACDALCSGGSAVHCMIRGDLLLHPAGGGAPNKEGAAAAYSAACKLKHEPGCAKEKELSVPATTPPPSGSGAPTATNNPTFDIDDETAPVKHIVVMWLRSLGAPASVTRTQAQAQARALEAMNKLKAGAKFEDVMREYTDDEPSKSRGGVPDAQMLGRVYAMAETMKSGDVIMVLTSVGYHVLLRTSYPFGAGGQAIKKPIDSGSGVDTSPSSTPSAQPSTPPSTQPSTPPTTQPTTPPTTQPSAEPSTPATTQVTPPDEAAQKRALEPRVYNGTASLEEMRLLKAICQHMGDMQCKAKAVAAIAQKQAQPPP